MSNYDCFLKVLETGKFYPAVAMDDHFGVHQYGYFVEALGRVFRADEVEEVTIHQVMKPREDFDEVIKEVESEMDN